MAQQNGCDLLIHSGCQACVFWMIGQGAAVAVVAAVVMHSLHSIVVIDGCIIHQESG